MIFSRVCRNGRGLREKQPKKDFKKKSSSRGLEVVASSLTQVLSTLTAILAISNEYLKFGLFWKNRLQRYVKPNYRSHDHQYMNNYRKALNWGGCRAGRSVDVIESTGVYSPKNNNHTVSKSRTSLCSIHFAEYQNHFPANSAAEHLDGPEEEPS